MTTDNIITVHTPTCFVCGKRGIVNVSADAFLAWQSGNGPIQEFFPNESLDVREQMISGTHPVCWSEIYGD